MKIRVIHKGFNFSQDGPGNRLVYHLQGCNFHCPWCSNPESMPVGGVLMKTPQHPDGKMSFTEYETDALIREILAAEPMFFEGGGVTFTGGEPTLQLAALTEILTAVHAAGIHTAIETNGSSPALASLLGLLDLVIIDCKHYDPAYYREIGGDFEQVAANLRLISESGTPCAVRTPLIAWFNAADGDEQGFVQLLRTVANPRMTFELLPYHEYGKDKWAQCGWQYQTRESAVTPETLKKFRAAFEQGGLKLIKT